MSTIHTLYCDTKIVITMVPKINFSGTVYYTTSFNDNALAIAKLLRLLHVLSFFSHYTIVVTRYVSYFSCYNSPPELSGTENFCFRNAITTDNVGTNRFQLLHSDYSRSRV